MQYLTFESVAFVSISFTVIPESRTEVHAPTPVAWEKLIESVGGGGGGGREGGNFK